MKGLLLIGALCVALAIAGCGSPSATPPASDAPLGMIRIKDAPSFPPGSAIFAPSGAQVGTVVRFDPSHNFPNGENTSGVLVQQAPDLQNWMDLETVKNGYFLKQ